MNRYVTALTALAVTLATGGAAQQAGAQSQMMALMGHNPQGASHPTRSASRPTGYKSLAKRAQHELPAPRSAQAYPEPIEGYVEGYSGEGHFGGDVYFDGEGYGGEDCCGDEYGYGGYGCGDCCDDGYSDSCGGGSWWDFWDCCDLFGSQGVPKQWYFTADYLYVRASFSQAVAYLIHDDSNAPVFIDEFHQLDFQHDSSYRFGAAYRLACCDEEVRFLFTRMSSYADDEAPEGAVVPYEISVPPGGETLIHGDVDTKSWDLMYAKTIPLGGPMACGCECGDPCGCGDGCGNCGCPAWDITWSGGIRFAEVDWNRSYRSFDVEGEAERDARVRMDFEGGGPKFGLEGRRYFGECGWFSLFLKGDISLLLGKMNLESHRLVFGETETVPPNDFTQTISCRHIIPVTEIEAGLSARITSSSTVSAGYLFSAWHDLGFRDEFNLSNVTFLETDYDDANILGFDGFFARLEWGF